MPKKSNQKSNKEIGYVKSRGVTKEMEESYIDYAMSVIVSRALPDVRDGLKPVQRRILYAMHKMGLKAGAKFKKSATVVGECFVKDSMVLADYGLVPIQEIESGDKVYTQDGLKEVTQLYHMPPKPLVEVTMDNGLSVKVTSSQEFKILTSSWEYKWKKAGELNEDDYLVLKTDYPQLEDKIELKQITEEQPSTLNENIAYLLGLFAADGSMSNDYSDEKLPRLRFCLGDEEKIAERVVSIFEEEFGYSPTIEKREYDYEDKQGEINHNKRNPVRINRKAINIFFAENFNIENQKASSKRVPAQIFRSPAKVIFSFVSGLMDGDGHLSESKSNFLQYGSVSEELIDQLQILLQHQEIFGKKYTGKKYEGGIINGHRVHSRERPYSLEFHGKDAVKLAENLDLAKPKKKKRAQEIASHTIDNGQLKRSKFEVIPYAGRRVFEELSQEHLGGGWYKDTNGDKFRMGVKHQSGCKIRYSSDLKEKPLRKTQIIDWGIKDKLERIDSSLVEFLNSVVENNLHFLKVSSVKGIEAEKTYDFEVKDDHEFVANGLVSHNCIGKYHPHGDQSIYDALVRMVQDFSFRYPLVKGQGNFGCFTGDTKVKLTDGRSLSFEELVKEGKQGKDNYTFSFNPEKKKIEITKIKNPRLTRKNEKIMKVVLDNGEEIKCTLDHRFMLRDGNYKEAQNLKEGDSLMSLSIKESAINADSQETACSTVFLAGHPINNIADKNSLFKKTKTTSNEMAFVEPRSSSTRWPAASIVSNQENLSRFFNDGDNQKAVEARGVTPRRFSLTNETSNYSAPTASSLYQNHKVVSTKILKKKEDVYDITTEPSHNFALEAGIFVHNSLDGDPPAAYRYTESKMSKVGQEMLRDIDKDTVDFEDNYDGTKQEPKVLPSPLPQLLLNGCLGIAVGVATKIPPHNLSEVVDASIYLLDHPDADTEDLFKFIQGPDFPTGGIIYNRDQIISAYAQGKGPVVMRGSAEIKEGKGRSKIIINEIPYQVQKSSLIKKIAKLVKQEKIEGIKGIRDESSRGGIRIVIPLKQGSYPKQILSQLYKFTRLQKTFHLNAVALVDGIQPRVLSLPELINYFLEHRKEVVLKRTKYLLNRAEHRAHILEGLDKALSDIDAVIETIKKAKHKTEAGKKLRAKFDLTVKQADAVLAIRLARLSKLEREKIEKELKQKKKQIKEYNKIIGNSEEVKKIVKKELRQVKKEYGDPRRTRVVEGAVGEISKRDLVPSKKTLITLTQGGYIKRVNPKSYKVQNRGGKGIIGMKTGEGDWVKHFVLANTLDELLFFTDSGKVFKIPAYKIPAASREAKGRGISNFLNISTEEKVLSIIPLRPETKEEFLIMATENGIINKTPRSDFENIRQTGIKAINLKENDLLKKVKKCSKSDQVIMISEKGKAIRFKGKEVRATGRPSAGVKGIDLAKGDKVVGMDIIKKQRGRALLVITENGFGKRTKLKKYRIQSRAGKGLKTANLSKKTGNLIAAEIVKKSQGLIVISKQGQVIRIKTKVVPVQGRATQGVRVMKLNKKDQVASLAII